MRHGENTLVDGNIFIGNNKPSTGGIRVINGKQTVTNNYGIGLTGYRFRGAFVIMNGVKHIALIGIHPRLIGYDLMLAITSIKVVGFHYGI